MTRPINHEARAQEERVQLALEGVKSGLYRSLSEAAKQLDIPRATLYHRAKGHVSRTQGQWEQRILSEEEETELVRWITKLTAAGYPPKHHAVGEMAESVQTRHVKAINDESIAYVSYQGIGKQWVRWFIAHHPELESIIGEQIEVARVKDVTRERLEKWFQDVDAIIKKYNIQEKDIYDMDEMGSSIGTINATHVIVDKTLESRYSTQLSR